MSDWMRAILHKMFGTVFVVLEDFDGELTVSRVRWKAGEPHANRHAGFSVVRLMPDGRCKGASYVSTWRPYIPLSFGPQEAEQKIRVVK